MANKRVLIVDDEPDIVESIKFNLELEKIECIEALDGEEALSKARKEGQTEDHLLGLASRIRPESGAKSAKREAKGNYFIAKCLSNPEGVH